MAPRKKKATSNKKDASVLRVKNAGVEKKKTGTPPKTSVKRHRNGRLNLTKIPNHLVEKAQRNSTQSPLLRLPPELRNKIWALAVKVDRVQAYRTRCLAKDVAHSKRGAVATKEDGAVITCGDQCPKLQPAAFHLPEVCRQIYVETGTLAYSGNIFMVPPSTYEYKNWTKKLLLAQRDAITTVELTERALRAQFLYQNQYGGPGSLRKRGLRNLTHCYISLQTQASMVKKFAKKDYEFEDLHELRGDNYARALRKFQYSIESRLERAEGTDLVVIFQKEEAIKTEVLEE